MKAGAVSVLVFQEGKGPVPAPAGPGCGMCTGVTQDQGHNPVLFPAGRNLVTHPSVMEQGMNLFLTLTPIFKLGKAATVSGFALPLWGP